VAVHIFAVSEENYKVCVERGLVAIPEAKEGPRHDNIVDGLLSRLWSSVTADDGIVTIVAAEPLAYRKSTRSVKKTLTIPEWLNTEAEKRHINFSSVLQQALIATIE